MRLAVISKDHGVFKGREGLGGLEKLGKRVMYVFAKQAAQRSKTMLKVQ